MKDLLTIDFIDSQDITTVIWMAHCEISSLKTKQFEKKIE